MIDKLEFISIINKLIEVNDFVDETNNKARQLNDAIVSDFFNASSLSISHETVVVKLLENMFEDKDNTISWWIYEKDYGRNYKIGDMSVNDLGIDLTTPEKLYDHLIKEYEENKNG